MRRSEAARRARAALDKVGLLAREKANPIPLSGGEQQRLVHRARGREPARRSWSPTSRPPTSTRSPRRAILDIFVAFNQVGVTVLIATHDEALVERYGKRVLRPRGREAAGMSAWLRQHRQALRRRAAAARAQAAGCSTSWSSASRWRCRPAAMRCSRACAA